MAFCLAVTHAVHPRWDSLRMPASAHDKKYSRLLKSVPPGTKICGSIRENFAGKIWIAAPEGLRTRAISRSAAAWFWTCSKTWNEEIRSKLVSSYGRRKRLQSAVKSEVSALCSYRNEKYCLSSGRRSDV